LTERLITLCKRSEQQFVPLNLFKFISLILTFQSSAQYWPEDGQKITFNKIDVISIGTEKTAHMQTRTMKITHGEVPMNCVHVR